MIVYNDGRLICRENIMYWTSYNEIVFHKSLIEMLLVVMSYYSPELGALCCKMRGL